MGYGGGEITGNHGGRGAALKTHFEDVERVANEDSRRTRDVTGPEIRAHG